ncbi:MAG: hypothetical protein IPK83_02550 [Planctomycetes bacterium]|nr:hypothetical protein [Planctomycetota bacterium]
MDADGDIDTSDVPLFVNVLLGLETDPGRMARADMNADETADGKDVQLIVDAMLE